MKNLLSYKPEKICIRSTNWIGDAVMTTPAVRTIRHNFPDAEISILAYPWVADVFRASPNVDHVILYEKDRGHPFRNIMRISRHIAAEQFDMAILLQHAFEAAMIAWLARIP
jgi:heptosyltransferase-2